MRRSKRFIWNDSYSVHVPSLDAQHKGFFDITNKILDLLDNRHDQGLKQDLILSLVELGNYALDHLKYEEVCINKYRCRGCEGHPMAHDVYREKVQVYLRKVREEDADIYQLAQEVAVFSQNWLSNHIANMDKEYVDCMTSQGAK